MYFYRIYCTNIISDIEFIQLQTIDESEAYTESAIYIKNGTLPEKYRFDEDCYSLIGEAEAYLSNYTCYLYVTNGNTITYEIKNQEEHSDLQTYILGWGMSMLLHQRKRPVIHCSALYKGDNAILISGESGSGKSTMTTYLLEKGFSFMADDTSATYVDGDYAYATPCFPFRKLCRDVVVAHNLSEDNLIYIDEDKDKFLVPWEKDFPDEAKAIKALIYIKLVEESADVTSKEITGFEKVGYIRQALFLNRLYKPVNNNAHLFEMCLRLAEKMPIFVITRPVNKDSREDILSEILKLTNTL